MTDVDVWDTLKLTRREQAILKTLVDVIGEALRVRDERILALEGKTLADAFKGSWLAGTNYRRGEIVQKGNASWLCMSDTDEQPGHSPSWRLWAR